MKKRLGLLIGFIVLVFSIYFLGPRQPDPAYPDGLPVLPADLRELDQYIQKKEGKQPLRRDNQARIIWQQDSSQVTEYSVVYLHGFAGSYQDGYPVNVQLADTLGANIFLSRLPGHGLPPPYSLEEFTPETAWQAAREALAIGKTIGKKVILLSTSTGGTLAVKLAATYPESVHALINLSPNIQDDFNASFVLDSPWGYEIARLLVGRDREIKHEKEIETQYWDTLYTSDALVELEVLVGSTMTEKTFRQVTSPVLTLYYYENFIQEDEHVEVEVYPRVHRLMSTPDSLKRLVQLKTPKTHFIGSEMKSEDTVSVMKEIVEFLREVLKIPVQSPGA